MARNIATNQQKTATGSVTPATIIIATITSSSIAVNYTLPATPSFTTILSIMIKDSNTGISTTVNGAPGAQTGTITLTGLSQNTTYSTIYIYVTYPDGFYSQSTNVSGTTGGPTTAATITLAGTSNTAAAVNYILAATPSYTTILSIMIKDTNTGISTTVSSAPAAQTSSITLTGLDQNTSYSGIYIYVTYPNGTYSQSATLTALTLNTNSLMNLAAWTSTIIYTDNRPTTPFIGTGATAATQINSSTNIIDRSYGITIGTSTTYNTYFNLPNFTKTLFQGQNVTIYLKFKANFWSNCRIFLFAKNNNTGLANFSNLAIIGQGGGNWSVNYAYYESSIVLDTGSSWANSRVNSNTVYNMFITYSSTGSQVFYLYDNYGTQIVGPSTSYASTSSFSSATMFSQYVVFQLGLSNFISSGTANQATNMTVYYFNMFPSVLTTANMTDYINYTGI